MTLYHVLTYFMVNVVSAATGIMYWLSIENLQPVEMPARKFQHLWTVAVLTILFSPALVWLATTIFRLRQLRISLRDAA